MNDITDVSNKLYIDMAQEVIKASDFRRINRVRKRTREALDPNEFGLSQSEVMLDYTHAIAGMIRCHPNGPQVGLRMTIALLLLMMDQIDAEEAT
jgi:hypothetical protein